MGPAGDLPPHELLLRYLADHIGRASRLFGPLADDLFRPLVMGVTEQLSIYTDMLPGARLRVGAARLIEGATRSYVLVEVSDRRRPLRLALATARYGVHTTTGRADEFVARVNARRWRFCDRHLQRVIEPIIRRIGSSLLEYYARRPYAQVKPGILRILEDVDRSYVCVEIDDRGEAPKQDNASRYWVQ